MEGLSYHARVRTAFCHVFLLGLMLAGPTFVRAQLVADGQTNVLDGVATNLTTGITVGLNGAFTLLVLTNGATVTNTSGNASIGYNASAQSNRVVVTDADSIWNDSGEFHIGDTGSFSELDILNGGLVTDVYGMIGYAVSSHDNLVVVSDPGSVWQSMYVEVGLQSGTNNQLVVTNGGQVISGVGALGLGKGGSSVAWVTGNNSVWTNSGPLTVGSYGSSCLLVVTNGGKLFSGSSTVGGMNSGIINETVVITGAGSSWSSSLFWLGKFSGVGNRLNLLNGGTVTASGLDIGSYSSSNLLTVADAGSALQCQTFALGSEFSSTANQCIISNGATLAVLSSIQPTLIQGTFTAATITGAGSVWTNAGDFQFGQVSNTLAITSGGRLVNNNAYINNTYSILNPNIIIVAGANSLWNNRADLHVADVGTQLLVTNGGTVIDNNGYLGDSAGNNNNYALVSGPRSVWTNRAGLYIGNYGDTNQLVVADLGLVWAQNFYLGANSASTNNRTTVIGGSLVVTNFGSGTVNLVRGTLTLNSGLVQCDTLMCSSPAFARLVFNGGALQMHNSSVAAGSLLTVGDGTDAATLMLTTIGLAGGNHNLSNGLLVSSNASLTGAGTVNGNVSIGSGGTLVPGTTNVWFLTLNGGLGLSNGCTTVMGLYPLAGSARSVKGISSVAYGGTLQLNNLGGTYGSGQSYSLFQSTSYSGAFDNLIPATPGAGLRWDTNQLNIDGTLRIFSIPTPPPAFSSVAQTGGNLVVTATAGIPYDPCYLFTSTNLATPLSDWTCVTTNYFDVTGATSFTNAIPSDEPARFYQLQVN
ncbi:MAG: hypothetical protein WAO02_08085 [Verrucomicrobiia bacterium]